MTAQGVTPATTRRTDLVTAERLLGEVKDLIARQRDATDRDDPHGRHLSLAITHVEDALLRLGAAR